MRQELEGRESESVEPVERETGFVLPDVERIDECFVEWFDHHKSLRKKEKRRGNPGSKLIPGRRLDPPGSGQATKAAPADLLPVRFPLNDRSKGNS